MIAALEFFDARRRLGLSLSELSRRTGLSIGWLEAVETADAAQLADISHLREDLRVLALAVGLDPEHTTARYLAELSGRLPLDEFDSEASLALTRSAPALAPDPWDAFVSEVSAPQRTPSWRLMYAASLTAAVIGATTAMWLSTGPQPATLPIQPPRLAALNAVASANFRVQDSFSGLWTLTSLVDGSNVAGFNTVALGFRLRLDQVGNRIQGDGFKWSENGRPVTARRRTPIRVEGTIDGNLLALKVTEPGTPLVGFGNLTMQRVGNGWLSGQFSTDAGQSTGRAVAVRISLQH